METMLRTAVGIEMKLSGRIMEVLCIKNLSIMMDPRIVGAPNVDISSGITLAAADIKMSGDKIIPVSLCI